MDVLAWCGIIVNNSEFVSHFLKGPLETMIASRSGIHCDNVLEIHVLGYLSELHSAFSKDEISLPIMIFLTAEDNENKLKL